MGAAYCCAGQRDHIMFEDIDSGPLEIRISNDQIFGIENYMELEDIECEAKYKNEHEVNGSLALKRSNLMAFYKRQIKAFQKYDPNSIENITVEEKKTPVGLQSQYKTILVRMRFH